MDEWVDGWMDGWIVGWRDGGRERGINTPLHIYVILTLASL
jgi:hypothetical protein